MLAYFFCAKNVSIERGTLTFSDVWSGSKMKNMWKKNKKKKWKNDFTSTWENPHPEDGMPRTPYPIPSVIKKSLGKYGKREDEWRRAYYKTYYDQLKKEVGIEPESAEENEETRSDLIQTDGSLKITETIPSASSLQNPPAQNVSNDKISVLINVGAKTKEVEVQADPNSDGQEVLVQIGSGTKLKKIRIPIELDTEVVEIYISPSNPKQN